MATHHHLTVNVGGRAVRDAWSEAAREAAAKARKEHSGGSEASSASGAKTNKPKPLTKMQQRVAENNAKNGPARAEYSKANEDAYHSHIAAAKAHYAAQHGKGSPDEAHKLTSQATSATEVAKDKAKSGNNMYHEADHSGKPEASAESHRRETDNSHVAKHLGDNYAKHGGAAEYHLAMANHHASRSETYSSHRTDSPKPLKHYGSGVKRPWAEP